MTTAIRVRPATPSGEDGDHFATLAEMAAHGQFEWLMGRRWRAVLLRIVVEPSHELSYENARFAEVDGQVAGLLAGYATEQRALPTWQPLERVFLRHALWQLPRIVLMGLSMLPLLRWSEYVPAGAYYITLVAVYAEFRGRGVSQRLLGAASQTALEWGCTSLALDVATDNDTAIAAYTRYGLTVEGTSPTVTGKGRHIALHRMVKRL